FHVVSLADASTPALVRTVKLGSGASLLDMQAMGGALYVTEYETLPGADSAPVNHAAVRDDASASSRMLPPFWIQREQARYYVTPFAFSAAGTPSAGRRVNVPGRPISVSGDMLLTLDQRWLLGEKAPQQHKHLCSLRLDLAAGKASLLDMTDVPEGVDF